MKNPRPVRLEGRPPRVITDRDTNLGIQLIRFGRAEESLAQPDRDSPAPSDGSACQRRLIKNDPLRRRRNLTKKLSLDLQGFELGPLCQAEIPGDGNFVPAITDRMFVFCVRIPGDER